MTTKLHFWDVGDRSAGIGGNQTTIELELDGDTPGDTAENIAHAKKMLSKALWQVWDNGTVHAVTDAELETGAEPDESGALPVARNPPLSPELAALIRQAQGHMLRTPEADAVSVKLTQYLMNVRA